mgnify:CR=1 FL=1
MKSPTGETLDCIISKWDKESIVYICDALGGASEIIYCLDIEQEHKEVLFKLLTKAQKKAKKMEDAIISKNNLLKLEGYTKCPHCRTMGKIENDLEGKYYSCCGMPY